MTIRLRTGYSFKTAFGPLDKCVQRLKDIGLEYAPITDRNSTHGHTRWTKLCKEAGLRPAYGVELGVCAALGEKKQTLDHWSFIATESLRPLHDLIYLATSNPGREPSLLYKQAMATPGIVKIAGERLLLEALTDEMVADPDFYVALSPSIPKGLFNKAVARGCKFIASSDNYFPRQEDEEAYRIMLGWRGGTQTYPRWILSDDEWRDAVSHLYFNGCTYALSNRAEVFARCTATQKHGQLLRYHSDKSLRDLCTERAIEKLGPNLKNPIYLERLEKELALIKEKDFEDYFFIISDLIRYAKEHMLVGPARGSSCGSLVCYLLDITSIDPIPYGLIFERFIDTTRKDLPDIDIDFSDEKRDMVFDYAREKYGRDRVAKLGSVGLFAPRSAIKQAAEQLQIPKWRADKVLDSIIERSSGDSRAMLQLEDTLKETEAGKSLLQDHPEVAIAATFEGHPNNPSQHAAGLIIADEPIMEYVAVDARTRATMCNKKDAESINLLKIDALGITQLSIFERTLELIGEKPNSAFFDRLPLDDKEAFDVLNKGLFSGIFQFTGTALRSLAKQVKVTHIEDIIAMTALARPGPLATGGAMAWIKRKRGDEPVSTVHPMLTELTKGTFGVVLYQETVMHIVREMGKFSWEDTSAIRKAMSGRLGDEFFARYKENFIKGAGENDIEPATAEIIWKQINTMGSWAFNRSHAVAYGIMSYWSCWLKAHHSLAFAAATLDAEKEPSKQIAVLRELADEGVSYVPFDKDRSVERWSYDSGERTIVGPLTTVKGIGPALMKEILDCRRTRKPLRAAVRKRLENGTTDIDSLYPIRDRIRSLIPDAIAAGIVTPIMNVRDIQPGVKGDVVITALVKKIAPKDENEAVNIQKRGYRVFGPDKALNLFFADDEDEIFCKIGRYDFSRLASVVLDNGKVGKSLFAVKGQCPSGFRMISISNIRYLGEME